MSKTKKITKVKSKNLIIFIICIILIVISITYGLSKVNKKQTTNKPNVEDKVPNNKKPQEEKPQEEKELTEMEKAKRDIKYYIDENETAYLEYRNKNKDMTIEKVILNVNMGLNNKYYTNTKESKYQNTYKILVNKYNYVTESYIPNNLEQVSSEYSSKSLKLVNYAKEAFEEMARAAKAENYTIRAMSSYRDYAYQNTLYNNYAKRDGYESADTYSARPGYSEHQTGLAVDIDNAKEYFTNFENTKEFTWMQNNAYKYGFILRFPKDKVTETGYEYESWHYRYVGKEIAKYIHDNNLCYEEYYAANLIQEQVAN